MRLKKHCTTCRHRTLHLREKFPGLPGPCGGEEHGVPTSWNMLQDLLDLRFKAHVQHSISFIQYLSNTTQCVFSAPRMVMNGGLGGWG